MDKKYFIDSLLLIDESLSKSQLGKAFDISSGFHEGQLRLSGEEYITHPLEVAKLVAGLGLGTNSVVAAILHDTVEDTEYTIDELNKDFGDEVKNLVDGVTKLSSIVDLNKKDMQAENIKKMFLAMSKDIRVLIIKLCDRLHNLRTIKYMPPDHIIDKCKETLEIYAPLAARLGISKIKIELEDISLKYLEPEIYDDLTKKINLKKDEREKVVNDLIKGIKKKLDGNNISAEITGRPKHFYSIYKKLRKQKKHFNEIFDIIAIRIITDNINSCYEVLGNVHEMYKPIPGRFKDYISMPKPNGYRSIHTSVLSGFGTPFEIQIRTKDMHKIAEYGVAAHWKYKEEANNVEEEYKINWIKEALEWHNEIKDSNEFLNTLKIDLFSNQIFCFTPEGKIIELPLGSTPIDFAYKVHTDVGNSLIGAKVNESVVPINYELKNGEVVEILTSRSGKGPSLDWISIVKSNHARQKINAFFKKKKKEEIGKLEESKKQDEAKVQSKKENEPKEEKKQPELISQPDLTKNKYNKTSGSLRSDIKVKGDTGFLIQFAKCCSPIPGDEIIGYISKGRGVIAHRKDCSNILKLSDEEKERLIEISWNNVNRNTNYETSFIIYCVDRRGIIADLSRISLDLDVEILSLNMNKAKDNKLTIDLSVKLVDIEKVDKFIAKIKQLIGIIEIKRKNK